MSSPPGSAPLYTYIGTRGFEPKHPAPGSKDRRLTVNAIYAHGTKRSAKNALGDFG
ncbi:hypothetical protein ACXNSR_34350 [Streptomyces sp. NC-S4]